MDLRCSLCIVEGEALFVGLAEIGIIVAGFACVAASTRRSWTAAERVHFQILMVSGLAIMFFALLPLILFYVTHDAQSAVRLSSAGYAAYVAQVMFRRVRAFGRARARLRTYVWSLAVGPAFVFVLMVLNVLAWGSAGVHALALMPGLYVATAEFRLFVTSATTDG